MKVSISRRRDLGDAVRVYWRHLVPLALFPGFAMLVVRILPEDDVLLTVCLIAPVFFAVAGYALYPVRRKDAPSSFWGLACGVFLASPMIWVPLMSLDELLTGW